MRLVMSLLHAAWRQRLVVSSKACLSDLAIRNLAKPGARFRDVSVDDGALLSGPLILLAHKWILTWEDQLCHLA
jgi:hypothetical protein